MRCTLFVVPILSVAAVAVTLAAWPVTHAPAEGAKTEPAAKAPSSPNLPVAKAVLFSSGVGFFQREGEIEGNQRIDLSFPVGDINDLLKDLGKLTSLDETTLTRNLRPLIDAGWVTIHPGEDRCEKLIHLTDAGAAKLLEARPAWEQAQERLRSRLPKGIWSNLLNLLPELARLADRT